MTGGRVLVLGKTGRNFAAGMSGGVAYVLDVNANFKHCLNPGMVDLDTLDEDDWHIVRQMIARHITLTNSGHARKIQATLADQPIVKVMPKDYKRVRRAEAKARAENREPEFAELVGSM